MMTLRLIFHKSFRHYIAGVKNSGTAVVVHKANGAPEAGGAVSLLTITGATVLGANAEKLS